MSFNPVGTLHQKQFAPAVPLKALLKCLKIKRNPYIQEKPYTIQEPKLGKNEDSKEPGVQEGRKGP